MDASLIYDYSAKKLLVPPSQKQIGRKTKMESQLPLPIRDALTNNEVKSGLRLLAMALAGLLGAGGVSVLAYLAGGSVVAVAVGGVTLIITAITLLGALRKLGQPIRSSERTDRELLQTLVAMDRRALVVTQRDGFIVASNRAFEQLSSKVINRLQDIVTSDYGRQEISSVLNAVRQSGNGAAQVNLSGKNEDVLSLIGKRVGHHFVWQVSRQNEKQRLDQEKNLVTGWAQPVFEKLDCGVVLEDVEGNIHYANSVIKEWLGWEGEGYPLKVQFRSNESKLIVADGKRLDVDVTTIPLEAREKDRRIGNYRFIRRLDQMRSNLVPIDRKVLIDPIFDSAPIAIMVTDRKGGIKEYNRSMKLHPAGYGVDPDGSALELVQEEDRSALNELIADTYKGEQQGVPLDVTYSGSPERVGQVYSSIAHHDGEPYVVLYFVDLTQEKSLEKQFVQAQKMQAVGQLAGGVAHDFNNLLTAIIGFCDLLLVRHDAGDQSFSDIIQIKQNANRAADLVRQLLAFSRQQTMRPKVLNVTDVLADLSSLIRRLIGEKIELVVNHGRNLAPLKIDQGQLEQVIINLAVNARDAMSDSGRLEMRSSMIDENDPLMERYDIVVPGDYILVEVIDTGCGIPADILEKIYEPFFTTKEVGQGTGLGLATVYGIIKQTGGFVFAESEVGVGTRFLLLFKAHEEAKPALATDEESEDSPERDLTGKGTILLVEDEDPVRMFACRALENKGYHVLQANSGEAGLEIVSNLNTKIDLLITDVVMPNMDGPALVNAARKDRPNLPVIFVSGYAEDVFRKNLEDEEFQFLPKPFTLKELAETVKSIMD